MGVATSVQHDNPLARDVDEWLKGPDSYAIGIDAGVSMISGGIVDLATGAVVRKLSMPSVGGDVVALYACTVLAGDLAAGHPVELICVAVPEIVRRTGGVESAANWDWLHLDVPAAFAAVGAAS